MTSAEKRTRSAALLSCVLALSACGETRMTTEPTDSPTATEKTPPKKKKSKSPAAAAASSSAASAPAPPAPPKPNAVSSYFGRAFLADANGDPTADVIGHEFTGAFFAVDGRDGHKLWDAQAPVDWFAVGGSLILGWKDKTFTVHAFDARDGHEIWKIELSDAYARSHFGPGCVVLHSFDGRDVALDAKTGKEAPCPAPPPPRVSGRFGEPVTVHEKGLDLVLEEEGIGTPRTSITRMQNGAPRWKHTLDVVEAKSLDGSTVSLAQGGLLVVGKKRSDPATAFLLFRLDPETGEVLKSIEVPTTRSIHRASLMTEGGLAVVANSGAVYAFDASTFERMWTAGRTQ